MNHDRHTHNEPLIKRIIEVAGFWTLANIGFYVLFPALGYELDYNAEPLYIAAYFLVCSALCMYYYWPLFKDSLVLDGRIKAESVISLGFAMVIWGLLYFFSFFPTLKGPALAPYTDILLATPWYFAPKMAEILLQQLLITVLVLVLYDQLRSLYRVIVGYAVAFGGAHVLLYALSAGPSQHATFMTLGALASAFVFPYLLLRVRGGFMYTYAIHVLFYIALVLVLHTWPPPGYGI